MGQWKVSEGDGIVMINPVVFWVLTKVGREPTEQERQEEFFNSKYFHHDGVWYETDTHYQGYDRDKLKPIDVVNKWRIGEGGTIKVRSTRLVTLASALLDDELNKCFGSWREIEMELWTYPKGKRRSEKLPLIEERPAEGLEGTIADDVFIIKSPMSAKFKRAWEDDDVDSEFLIDGVDRESTMPNTRTVNCEAVDHLRSHLSRNLKCKVYRHHLREAKHSPTSSPPWERLQP